MNKIAISLLFVTALSYGMEEEGLYLVVGSTRKSDIEKTFPVQPLWKEDKADFSLRNAYPGKETTSMDIKKSTMPGVKHIIGDASVYQFGKNTIQAAYLERLPTMDVFQTTNGVKSKSTEDRNYLGECVQNIGSAMKKGAIIEIEWHPYLFSSTKTNINEINTVYNEDFIKKNPFTAGPYIDPVIIAIEMACLKSLECDPAKFYSPQFIDCASKFSTIIKKMICFYEKENMGTKALLNKRLAQEIWLLRNLMSSNDKALLTCGPSASLEEFSKAIARFPFIPIQDSSKVGTFVTVQKNNELFSGKLYDLSLFLNESFVNFVLSDVAVEHNSAYVKEFMKDNGFKDISIERTTSLRNGRKNVWIVKGTKA